MNFEQEILKAQLSQEFNINRQIAGTDEHDFIKSMFENLYTCSDRECFDKSWSGDLQKRFPNGGWRTVNGASVFINNGKVVAGLGGFNGMIDNYFSEKKEKEGEESKDSSNDKFKKMEALGGKKIEFLQHSNSYLSPDIASKTGEVVSGITKEDYSNAKYLQNKINDLKEDKNNLNEDKIDIKDVSEAIKFLENRLAKLSDKPKEEEKKEEVEPSKGTHIGDMSKEQKLAAAKSLGIKDPESLSSKELNKQIIDKNIEKQVSDFQIKKDLEVFNKVIDGHKKSDPDTYEKLKDILNLYNKGDKEEAFKESKRLDTYQRELIPPRIYKDMGGKLTSDK